MSPKAATTRTNAKDSAPGVSSARSASRTADRSDKEGPAVSIGQHTSAGPKERNDDSFGVLVPENSLLATKGIAMGIADGMSSSDAAKEASETCVKSFLEDYYCTHESWSVRKSVGTVLSAVNNWLYGQGQVQYLSNRGMVTTFTGLVLKSGTAHIFHAGDSRLSLLRDGILEPLTRDHRVHVSRENSYLSRAFGIDPDLDIDYRAETMQEGDVLVFTTDGVHEFVAPGRMVAALSAHGQDLDAAARNIVEAALEAGSNDNVTCQIVHVDSPGRADIYAHLRKLTRLPFPPELSPGMMFEGYRVISELHASKRTQVYLAEDTATKSKVVLKTPSVNFEDDPAYLEMFTREDWIGKRIKSPHVVRVLEPVSPRRYLYYVTEFVEGRTLRTWMQQNPKPNHKDVRIIVDQIAAGLRAFHRKDMIHQDLKPENIVIDSQDTVKIIDFGSTGVAGLAEIDEAVEMPSLVGTEGYTAPEYQRGYKPTNRSDIYSLGTIAYEMLTGALPYGQGFSDPRSLETLNYKPAFEHNPDVPPWVDAALAKATNRDPEKRYDVLSAFIADLARPGFDMERAPMKPLLDRDPVVFWKAVAISALLANIVLLAILAS